MTWDENKIFITSPFSIAVWSVCSFSASVAADMLISSASVIFVCIFNHAKFRRLWSSEDKRFVIFVQWYPQHADTIQLLFCFCRKARCPTFFSCHFRVLRPLFKHIVIYMQNFNRITAIWIRYQTLVNRNSEMIFVDHSVEKQISSCFLNAI